jgi:hypothetical protein
MYAKKRVELVNAMEGARQKKEDKIFKESPFQATVKNFTGNFKSAMQEMRGEMTITNGSIQDRMPQHRHQLIVFFVVFRCFGVYFYRLTLFFGLGKSLCWLVVTLQFCFCLWRCLLPTGLFHYQKARRVAIRF